MASRAFTNAGPCPLCGARLWTERGRGDRPLGPPAHMGLSSCPGPSHKAPA